MTGATDVIFMLLFFFMTVTVFNEKPKHVKIGLPSSLVQDEKATKRPINLFVNREMEEVHIEFEGALYSLQQIKAQLSSLEFSEVHVHADKNAKFSRVAKVKKMLAEIGVKEILLISRPK